MQPQLSRRLKRLGASALAAGLAITAIALPAQAAPGAGNIDPDAPVSLTLHKYVQPDGGTLGENDGTEIPNPQGTALDGVEFTFERVESIDLLTNDGWAKADGLNAATVMGDPASYPLGTPIVRTTAGGGKIELASPEVQIGVYLVRETAPGPNPIVQPSVPFLVTLPMPSQTGSGDWNTNVHVYPKNALNTVNKEVDDSGATLIGDTVKWTVTSEVPVLPEGTQYEHYRITDQLDDRLGFTSATVKLLSGGGESVLVTPDHYGLTTSASGLVEILFTQEALTLFDQAGANAKVQVELVTEVLSLGNGVIENQAIVFINDPDSGFESNVVESHWGAAKILKYAKDDTSKTLAGAEFDLYAVDPASAGAQPVRTGITTGSDGTALIDGLKVGDYWLVETVAPTGYELLTSPIPFTVTVGSVAEAVVVQVPNTQVPPFTLPLTGGAGSGMFILGGGALLALAAGLLVAARRRSGTAVAGE